MKKIHKILGAAIILIIVIFFIFLITIFQSSSHYVFRSEMKDIVSIELMHNNNEFGEGINMDNIVSIRFLSKEEIPSFMADIYAIPTQECYPPRWGWGYDIAKVTYANGDIEMLGSLNIEYIAAGDAPFGTGRFCFEEGYFEGIFSMYASTNYKS